MNILFCNITYQRYYDGRTKGEYLPKFGGSHVAKNKDAHEKWNFLNVDGYCYGYVHCRGQQMQLERLSKCYRNQEEARDVTVIWCARHPFGGTVVVGWYAHATVYRHFRSLPPYFGPYREYWIRTKAEDAYLLPLSERTFEIGRSSQTGTGTGFGQQNYWFADSQYAAEQLIPPLLKFLDAHRHDRMNTQKEAFLPSLSQNSPPLSQTEREQMDSLDADEIGEEMQYLHLAYRQYAAVPSAENAYLIAQSLTNLFQYRLSIPWYQKTLALDSENWNTAVDLALIYLQCGKYKESIALAEKLLKSAAHLNADFRDELYCILADNYYFMG